MSEEERKKEERKKEDIRYLKRHLLDEIDDGYCLIIGTNQMIDKYTEAFGVNVYIVMTSFMTKESKVEHAPMEIFDGRTKDIKLLGAAKKKDILDAGKASGMINDDSGDFLVAISLVERFDKEYGYRHGIDGHIAKTDQEKVDFIDSLFRVPGPDIEKDVDSAKKRKDAYIYSKGGFRRTQ